MRESLSRREILAASAATTAALAGCADSGGDGGGNDGDGEQPLLHSLRLTNATNQAHTVHVVVERGGEFVHWSTHQLGPQGGDGGGGGNGGLPPERTAVERTWSDDRGEYVIHARLDDRNDWQTVDIADLGEADGGCWGVDLEATGDGEFSVWSSQNPEGCPSGGENNES
jgi:hypothetical protein